MTEDLEAAIRRHPAGKGRHQHTSSEACPVCAVPPLPSRALSALPTGIGIHGEPGMGKTIQFDQPWDRVHNRPADVYTPPEDVIERPKPASEPAIRMTVHGHRVVTKTFPASSETWEGIKATLNLGFRVTLELIEVTD